jgi:hypothetical protein
MILSRKSLLLTVVGIIFGLTLALTSTVGAAEVTLESGTIIFVENVDTLDPSDLNVGDSIDFRVYDDVVVDGYVVINGGSPVSGTVTKAQGEGALGKAAKLTVQVKSVEAVDGTIIGLSGSQTVAGEDKSTEAVGGGLFLCAPMLLMKGEAATIPANTRLECRVMSTKTIRVN